MKHGKTCVTIHGVKNSLTRIFVMTRPGVTYHDVVSSAQKIIASGYEPTIERIRADLKTGSNSTIGTHLRNWRSKQDSLQQLATKEKIPEELVTLLKGLWDRVMDQAEEKLESVKKEAQTDSTTLRQTIQQLQQENARLQQSEYQLKQSRDGLAHEKATIEQLLNKAQTESVTSNTKIDSLIQQLDDKKSRIDELHKQNQQTQANLEHYRAASLEQRQLDQQRAEQQQRELTHTLQQLRFEKEELLRQQIELQKLYADLQSDHKNTQHNFEKLTTHSEAISAELIELTKKLAVIAESEKNWQSQHKNLISKFEAQSKLTLELQTQNAVLRQHAVEMKSELKDIKDQNKSLAHDKWILGQEKAQLEGQMKQLQTVL